MIWEIGMHIVQIAFIGVTIDIGPLMAMFVVGSLINRYMDKGLYRLGKGLYEETLVKATPPVVVGTAKKDKTPTKSIDTLVEELEAIEKQSKYTKKKKN